jgi:hypothetical protein
MTRYARAALRLMVGFLLDTNVLLRSADTASPNSQPAVEAVSALLARGDDVFLTAQNVVEFWAVVTRQIGLRSALVRGVLARGHPYIPSLCQIPGRQRFLPPSSTQRLSGRVEIWSRPQPTGVRPLT